jgi:ABC-type bacteriocin/lantibiotic exporter with double-glycine peptidase domain
LRHLFALPYMFFQQRSAGDLMLRLNSNTIIREILTASALSGILDGTLMGLYVLLLLVMSPVMGALVLALGALHVGLFLATRGRQREMNALLLERQARAQSYQVEIFAGIETLKAMGCEERAEERFTNLFVDVLNASLARGRLAALLEAVSSALRLGAPLLILSVGALMVLNGQLSLGAMLALDALAVSVFGPLSGLVTTAVQLQTLGSYMERIADIHETPLEQDPAAVRPSGKLMGRIELDGVSFRYRPLEPLVVEDVSVTIAPGQLVAIVGRSGSGKSTLASLLLGLYRPTSGTIAYDGVDQGELELRSVRRQLGIVTQRAYIFGSTLRANIALSDPEMPLEEVVRAAKRARIHDEIMQMPMAYDTLLTDGGGSLSGGQRQRIALARALSQGPAILLLDEATSALDAITEREVQAELSRLSCTRIIIAHRLSTIVDADVILVMDEGRLVERGTHAELLAKEGTYADLVATQLSHGRE